MKKNSKRLVGLFSVAVGGVEISGVVALSFVPPTIGSFPGSFVFGVLLLTGGVYLYISSRRR